MGVEIWGTYDDLNILYGTVGKFWNQENFLNKKEFKNRDHLVSGFSYELRHAKDGTRLSREHSHYSFEPIKYLGFQISWVQMLFSLQLLRYNMRYLENNKYDLAMFLQIEHELEVAMRSFDEVGARKLIHFITDGIYITHPISISGNAKH